MPRDLRPYAGAERLRQLATANRGRGYVDVQNAGEEADVYLYGVIGWDFTAAEVAAELAPLRNTALVRTHLSSPGGDAWEGQAIYHTLRQLNGTREILGEGIVASAASTVAMAASPGHMVMGQGALMMIHEAWVIAMANKRELRATADWLEKLDDSIAGFYQTRAGGTRDHWLGLMEAETWMSDEEAVASGLADRVDGDVEASNEWDLSVFSNLPPNLRHVAPRDEDREFTKRQAERALRDAGMPAAAARALVASGWDALDADAREGRDLERLMAVFTQATTDIEGVTE